MNKRRWIIGIAAMILGVFTFKSIGMYRWSRLSAEEKAGTITEKMTRRFDLNEDQKGKVYALNLEKMRSVQAAKATGQHGRQYWKQTREQWKNQLREVLTPEQQQRFRH